jgi:TatD DNase family protein
MVEEAEIPVFADALFRQKRKKGRFRLVEPVRLEASAVDTHAHVHLLADPALEFARAAVWGVGFVCDIIDVAEDDPAVFGSFECWYAQAKQLLPQIAQASADLLAAGGTDVTRLPEGAAASAFDLPAGAAACELPHLRLACGVHPHNAKLYDDAMEQRLLERLADPRVCAVGEVGLDYHYDLSPREAQCEVFRRQIRLAHKAGLPIALHVREAHDEAFAILREEGFPEAGTLLHCFDLDWETLEPWVEQGCYVALGGALTFGRCQDTRDAVARTPRELLLTETDSPYMTPEPMRGMPCGPAHVTFTAARMAEVLGCEPGEAREGLLCRLEENARGLLDRPPTAWQREAAAAGEGGAAAAAPDAVASKAAAPAEVASANERMS